MANGDPAVATTASGDSKCPTAACDEEHTNVGIVVLGLGRIGVPHAVSADTNKAGIASRPDRRLVVSNGEPPNARDSCERRPSPWGSP